MAHTTGVFPPGPIPSRTGPRRGAGMPHADILCRVVQSAKRMPAGFLPHGKDSGR